MKNTMYYYIGIVIVGVIFAVFMFSSVSSDTWKDWRTGYSGVARPDEQNDQIDCMSKGGVWKNNSCNIEYKSVQTEPVQTDLSIKTNSQSVFLEGFQDSYKINDSIRFTLVFKDGQKCGTIELSLIDTKTSKFVNGIGFDDMCDSPYLSEDLRISIPYQEENSPFKTDKVGSYKIVITNGGETVLEKEFVVKSVDQS